MYYTFSKRDPGLKFLSIMALSLLVLTGCVRTVPSTASSPAATATASSPEPESVPRVQNAAQISRGAHLYSQNCAACHGVQAEGAPDWENPDAAGILRAPPLNGTGHTWHHPVPVLRQIITEGTLHRGGTMPPHQGVLTDQEVDDIIAWFLHLWPDATYQRWYRKWHHKGLPAGGNTSGS